MSNHSTGSEKDASVKCSPTVRAMMLEWGFVEGKGLGPQLQGRIELVKAVIHQGRFGIGHCGEDEKEEKLEEKTSDTKLVER